MNNQININTDACVVFANTLEKINKSALPVAVRTALNSAAFDVKQRTMPTQAKSEFIQRSKNFFKANSRVEMATGFNVNRMQSKVGMISENLKGQHNYSVKELEQQEHGGSINRRGFIPLTTARAGRSYTKLVRAGNRLSNINRIVDVNKIQGSTAKQRFIKAALRAGQGGFVLGNYGKSRILWKIDNIKLGRLRNKTEIKKTPLYDFKDGRKVSVIGTHFMKEASLKSASKLEFFFRSEANKQVEKLRK